MHDKPSVKGSMRRVVIESPCAGKSEDPEEYAREVEYNSRYLRACMADSFARGEAPYASHGLYTQPGVLDDKIPEERAKGIKAGFEWSKMGQLRVFYLDLGMTEGMIAGGEEAESLGQPVELRRLDGEWADGGGKR